MSLEDDLAAFRDLPVLTELDQEALRVLVLSTDTRNLRAGEILVRKGERSDGGYFVLSGSFALIKEEAPDNELSVIGAGGLIGEMALITQTEAPATVCAREPSTVLKVPRAIFQRVLREYPGSAARLRVAIEKRLAAFTAELAVFAARTE